MSERKSDNLKVTRNLFKYKAGENFNHRHTGSIPRITCFIKLVFFNAVIGQISGFRSGAN
jgi:hypothetical protein